MSSKVVRHAKISVDDPGKEGLKEAGLSICNANVCLAEGDYTQALDLYTSVLVRTAPGHPCAFLGRTLCYLVLGHPSLAAMDAWRALNVANLALEDTTNNPWKRQVMKFMKLTFQQTSVGAIWTTNPTCFLERGGLALLDFKLARINISRETVFKERVGVHAYFCHTIILKAYYLLALSLYQLGGGALRSALEMLADARELPYRAEEDIEQLTAIESEIFMTVGKQVDLEKATAGTPSLIQSLMDLRYARVPRNLYPWDTYCTGGNDLRVVDKLNRVLKEQFEGPSIKVSSTIESGHAFSLRLQAREGVIDSQDIFKEQSTLQVFSTDCAFFTYDGMFCDGCGSGMLVPVELLDEVEVEATEGPKSDWNDSDDDMPEPPQSSRFNSSRLKTSPLRSPRSPPNEPVTPPPLTPVLSPSPLCSDLNQFKTLLRNPPEGFSLCPVCKDAAFCSSACLRDCIKNHHVIICSRGLEQWVRDSVLPYQVDGLPTPHEQRMTSLLLLRIFATLFKYPAGHPLEHSWIQLLNVKCSEAAEIRHRYGRTGLQQCFPDKYDSYSAPRKLSEEEAERAAGHLTPWSFETNVRKPFNMLMYIGGPKLAFDVSRFDGWILNTLLMKIEQNAMTAFGPRLEKGFGDDGALISEQTLSRVLWIDATELHRDGQSEMGTDYDPVRWRERQVWTGSLYPLSSLVRVANEGEEANVIFYERGGTIICRPNMDCRSQRKDSAVDEDVVDWGAYASWPLPIRPGDELVRERKIRPLGYETDFGYETSSNSEMEMEVRFSDTSAHKSEETFDVEMAG